MQIGLVAAGAIARSRFGGSPAYTRLEPQSVSGDASPGPTAAVHDPLWMLLRQWQFGELAGEDNGRPLGVAVQWTTTPLATLTVGAGPSATVPIGDATLLDPAIQSGVASVATARARVEAGRALVVALEDAGMAGAGGQLATLFRFAAADIATAAPGLARVLRGGVDGRAAAAALGAGAPGWLPGPAQPAAAAWLAWWRASVEPAPGPSGWDRKRLEHRFSIDTGKGLSFSATEHVGRAADWWSVDASGVAAASADPPKSASLLAQPLRFPGMPADRYWEFEDGSVNLGGMTIETNDPVRRALVDFATLFGTDWFTVPVTVPRSGTTTIASLSVTDSFGVTTPIDPPVDGAFRLFQVTRADGKGYAAGLLGVPAAAVTLDGPPLESVLILRDEVANLGWAVEERVEDAAGGSRLRRDEPLRTVALPPPAAFPDGTPAPELRYTLETEVPPWWIPLVPMATTGQGGFVLRKGTMSEADDSRSRLLAGKDAVDFMDEEVPAAGLRVERVPRLARAPDGSLRRWVAFQVRSVNAPAASGLAFDGAAPI